MHPEVSLCDVNLFDFYLNNGIVFAESTSIIPIGRSLGIPMAGFIIHGFPMLDFNCRKAILGFVHTEINIMSSCFQIVSCSSDIAFLRNFDYRGKFAKRAQNDERFGEFWGRHYLLM